MAEGARDCAQAGHVWLEADGRVFTRHKGRRAGKIAVHCQYCALPAFLEGQGNYSGRVAPPSFPKPDPEMIYSDGPAFPAAAEG